MALRQLRHEGRVKCAKVFPRGDRVVTRIEEGLTVVWQASSGQVLVAAGMEPARRGRHFLDVVALSDSRLLGAGLTSSTIGVMPWSCRRA